MIEPTFVRLPAAIRHTVLTVFSRRSIPNQAFWTHASALFGESSQRTQRAFDEDQWINDRQFANTPDWIHLLQMTFRTFLLTALLQENLCLSFISFGQICSFTVVTRRLNSGQWSAMFGVHCFGRVAIESSNALQLRSVACGNSILTENLPKAGMIQFESNLNEDLVTSGTRLRLVQMKFAEQD